MIIVYNISIVIHIISTMRETETQLTGTITMTVSWNWRATMRMCMTQTVIVRRRRQVTQIMVGISEVRIVTIWGWNIVIVLSAISLDVVGIFYLKP